MTPTKDPVCGMTVDPAAAKAKAEHAGTMYYFCCAGCAQKFRTAPDQYLNPKPAASTLITLGAPKSATLLTTAVPKSVAVQAKETKSGRPDSAQPNYVCPMCPEIRQSKPGPCPSCGMVL